MKLREMFSRIKQVFYSVGYSAYGLAPRILEPFAGAWQKNVECESRESLLAFSATYAAASLISDDVSKLRIKLMKQTPENIWVETFSAAFSPVLIKPNRWQTRIQFLSLWMVSKLLYGNTYVLKVRDKRGLVKEMYVLDPRKVVPQITSEGDVYYSLNQDYLNSVTEAQYVPASEIIHDRMLCLFHPLVGVSPIYACAMSGTQGIKIQQQSASFFDNQSRPSGILTAPAEIDDPTAARLKNEFETNFSRRNIGRLLVAGNGLKYEPMTIPASDAQLIDQLRWTVEDVGRAFRIPPHKLGAAAPVHTSVVALNQEYYSQTLQTHIEAIEVLLDDGLGLMVKSGEVYGTELDLDGLLRMDPISMSEALSKNVGGGIMSPDEARFKLNLGSVPGGKYPYLQQQNYSLEALAKRDAGADPFGRTSVKPPSSQPPPEDNVTPPAKLFDLATFADELVAKLHEETLLATG